MPEIDPRILEVAQRVSAKRPKTIIDHLIKYGKITTEEIQEIYGYTHPPRAIRDVREAGIPIETLNVLSAKSRRTIAEYRFGSPDEVREGRHLGRRAFPSDFKTELLGKYGQRDHITGQSVPSRNLQIDHRVPYEIAGEPNTPLRVSDFMLLDGSMQRVKAFTCAECPNMRGNRDPDVCGTCYWAFPETHDHVAQIPIRRVDIVWSGEELTDHDAIVEKSAESGISIPSFIKDGIARLLNRER